MESNAKQLNEDQRAALVQFIEDKDRGKAVIFVGREAELSHVQGCINRLLRRRDESAPGSDLTTVIQGAPGAGKSALLEKIAEDWPLDGAGEGKPAAIRLAASALKLPMVELLEVVSCQVSGNTGIKRTLARFFSSISVNVAGMAGVTFGLDPSQLTGKSMTPVILLFDEIQSVLIGSDLQPQSNLAQNIRLLHTGEHNAPVFPIYGGLANSADLLRSAGLTRLAMESELTLPGFSDAEMDELMTRFVDEYLSSARPSSSTLERWGYALRRDSQGWPMHCRNFLIALCKEIKARDWRPEEVDLDAVRMRAQQLRFRYYAQRMQDALEEQEAPVSTVLEAMRRSIPMKRGQIVELIERAYQERSSGDSGRDSLPESMTARQVFDVMLHSGVVQKTVKGKFVCPIPSLASYIAAKATLPSSALHEAVLDNEKSDMDSVFDQCRDDEERSKLLQAIDTRKRTPLMLAVELGMVSVVEYLVEAEGRLPAALRSVEFRDSEGRTARDHAFASGDERIVALLDRLQPAGAAHEITG